MCDLRCPPKKVIDVKSKQEKDVCYNGTISFPTDRKDLIEDIYSVAATGSYYLYYDGNRWYKEGNEKEFVFDNNSHLPLLNEVKLWKH